MFHLEQIVNVERYPIQDIESRDGRLVVEACRTRFRETGLCLLPGFLRPEALSTMVRDAQELSSGAYITEKWGAAVPGETGDATSTDPRMTRARFGAVAYDRLAADSPLRMLYEWDGLTALMAAIAGQPGLKRTADPLVSCSLSYFREGDELGWHYDSNAATVSLLLQAPDEGGAFEYAPATRGSGADARERAALCGRAEGLVCPQLTPGTLSIFDGNHSLHRVSPVSGERERIIALLNYAAEPGHVFSEEVHMRFFGRTGMASRPPRA